MAAERAGWPPSIVIPWFTQFAGQDKPIAGQSGGRMGESFRPFLVKGDPSRRDFEVTGLELPDDVPLHRAERTASPAPTAGGPRAGSGEKPQGRAFSKPLRDRFCHAEQPDTTRAFELDRELPSVRECYGEHKFGQSLLLARRLVEAGISLVTVNWDDETFKDKVSPFWDTHSHNFPAIKDRLAPRFDWAFSAFLEDLSQRGLLETTRLWSRASSAGRLGSASPCKTR